MIFKKFLVFLSLLSSLIFIKGFFFPPTYRQIKIGNHYFWVKIAQTHQARQQGLAGKKQLGENEGMLFVFKEKQCPSFWMKGMLFPLDFIWLAGNKVVDLNENVPPSKTDAEISYYQPSIPVDKVLEVKAGSIKKYGIKIGQSFKIEN